MRYKSLIVDAHLDLSMNAIDWNRDLRMPVAQIRQLENGLCDKPDRGRGTVSFPSLREGNIKLVMATLIARYAKPSHPLGGWHSPEQAWAQTEAQLAWYQEMEKQGEISCIKNLADLELFLQSPQRLSYILSLEGADSILSKEHFQRRVAQGLRAIGPAHYGPGTYAYGTDSDEPLNQKGRELLQWMEEANLALDVTHLCDSAFCEAIELFSGTIWASHNNVRKLVDHNRQFSDEMVKALIEKGAVIGMALDAWMLVPHWERGVSQPKAMNVTLEKVVDHLVHVCTLAGDVNHVGIGSDLDGGFGTEQGPYDLDTIADLQKIPAILEKRGFTRDEIDQIMHKNWIRKFSEVLTHFDQNTPVT